MYREQQAKEEGDGKKKQKKKRGRKIKRQKNEDEQEERRRRKKKEERRKKKEERKKKKKKPFGSLGQRFLVHNETLSVGLFCCFYRDRSVIFNSLSIYRNSISFWNGAYLKIFRDNGDTASRGISLSRLILLNITFCFIRFFVLFFFFCFFFFFFKGKPSLKNAIW